MNSVELKQQLRCQVLKGMYEITTQHSPTSIVGISSSELAKFAKCTLEQAEEAAIFLAGEGLLKRIGMGTHEDGGSFVIQHEGRVEAERVIDEEAKRERPIFSPERIQLLFSQMAGSGWQTLGGVSKQLFSELDRTAASSPSYKQYEADRINKWKEWPAPAGSFIDSWSLPSDLDEAKSLAYDIFRSCSEGDGGVSLAFTLFRETQHADGISKLKDTFLRYFANAVEDIANDLGVKKREVMRQRPVPLEIRSMHAEVSRIAGHLVSDSHYRQAITDTFIGLDNYVQAKAGLTETGTALMQRAFSGKAPILELSKDSEEQTGFMMLFAGAMKAVRNQYAHSLIDPKSPEEALEWLGFASALFRLTDVAVKM